MITVLRLFICGLFLGTSWTVSQAEGESSGSLAGAHRVVHGDYFPVIRQFETTATAAMKVGTITESHDVLRIATESTATALLQSVQPADTLLITMVIPDDRENHAYDFELRTSEHVFHRRSGTTRGFGRRSFFVPLPPAAARGGTSFPVFLQNRSREDLYVSDFLLLRNSRSASPPSASGDDFTLSLLVNNLADAPLLSFVAALPQVPGVRKAICSEVYYARRSAKQIRAQLTTVDEVLRRHGLWFVPCLCSWWAGTPEAVFTRLDFQQICWADTDTHDEGQELRDFLGSGWDIRYGLTVPNKWSSTPWQTMNSPELNHFRHTSLRTATRLVEEQLGGKLAGYIAENEPAYWAFEGSDNKYPVRRRGLWADFNPLTVAHAARQGVVLDPADGLDLIERIWLHYNVADYNQATIDVLTTGGVSANVYSHALLDYEHFPLHGTGHARPYAEVARVRGARTGVEMIWKTDMDALWRLREWGPWACVNREEWDGYGIDYHLATLRACYMMGADMVNSYNWQLMGREGDPAEYFGRFLRNLGEEGGRVVVGERTSGTGWNAVRNTRNQLAGNKAAPWVNALELSLRCTSTSMPLEVSLVELSSGAVVAYRLLFPEEVSTTGSTVVRFGDLARLQQDQDLVLHLRAEDNGWEAYGSFWGPDYRLICDLNEERSRSMTVIRRPREGSEAVLLRSAHQSPRR